MSEQNDKFWTNIITGIAFLLFSAFFLYKNSQLPSGANTFPGMILVGLSLGGITLIIKELWKKYKTEGGEEADSNSKFNLKAEFFTLLFYLLLIVYMYILPKIGFTYSAVLYLLVGMWLINRKDFKRRFYFAFIVPVIMMVLFRIVLNVSLPASKLPF